MTDHDDGTLAELRTQTEVSDPLVAPAPDPGRPLRPGAHRRLPAYVVMFTVVALLTAGLMLPHGLLIASALVLAGAAGHLFDRNGAIRRLGPR